MINRFMTGAIFAVSFGVLATAPAAAEDLYFMLSNETGVDLTGFYISHTGTNDWENNLIEGGYLASGYEIEVVIADGRSTCMYDILSEFADGDAVEEYDVDLCEMDGYTLK